MKKIFAVAIIVFFSYMKVICDEEIKPKSIITPPQNNILNTEKNKLKISVGQSKVIEARNIIKTAVGNPSIADIVVISEKEILVNGKQQGTTSLTIWEEESKFIEYEIFVSKEQPSTKIKTFKLQNLWLKKYDYSIQQGKININVLSNPGIIQDLSSIISTILEKDKFSINPELNTIVVSATDDEIKKISDLIKEIDVPKPQVAFEAKIIEAGESILKEAGISWATHSKSVSATYNKDEDKTLSLEYIVPSALTEKYLATIKALEEKGKIQTLASPRLVVREGEVGKILVGSRVPVIRVTTDSTGARTETVEFVEVGISLSILPTKISDTGITTLIAPSVSAITEWRGNYPVISTRESISDVHSNTGESIIIGGLLSTREYEKTYQIPFLSDIPILGNMFKNKKREKEKTELIIIITPNTQVFH